MYKDDKADNYLDNENDISRTYLPNRQLDDWKWNSKYKSCDIRIFDKNQKCVIFHPTWSCGTSAVRGTKILNNTRSYWEIKLTERLFGTSMMFGIGTKKSRLGSSTFTNLIGEDDHSWGLSHKGLMWHAAKSQKYCRPFRENFPTTVGILFDGVYGTLTYFRDGVNLGVAFRDLHKIKEPLYPIISSTSAKTIMTLQATESEFVSLQDRCKAVILENVRPIDKIHELELPFTIREYLTENADSDVYRCNDCEWYVSRF